MIAEPHRLQYGIFLLSVFVVALFGLFVMLKCFGPVAVATKTYPEGPIVVVSAGDRSS